MQLRKNFWNIVFTVLLLVVIGLLVWFVADLESLYRSGELRPARGFSRNHPHKQILTPDQIKGWMTFSYINYIFNLPPNYLSESLTITDSHYPNLGIDQYVKTARLNSIDFIKKVQDSVSQYIKSNQ